MMKFLAETNNGVDTISILAMILPIVLVILLILIIRFTLKFRPVAWTICFIVSVGTSVGYVYRDKWFSYVFEKPANAIFGNLITETDGDFIALWIYLTVCVFIWIMYFWGSSAIEDDSESFYLIWTGSDDGPSKWSHFGLLVLISALIAAGTGFGITWLTVNVWNGFPYALSALEILIMISILIKFFRG